MLQMTRFIVLWDVTPLQVMPEDCSVLKLSENTRPMRECTSQKTGIFSNPAMRTSNLTKMIRVLIDTTCTTSVLSVQP